HTAGHQLAICSGRRGAKVDDLCGRKLCAKRVPALGDVVVPFVEQDEIEEVCRQLLKPAVRGALQLLNVSDDNIGRFKVCSVGRSAADLDGLRKRPAAEHVALDVE